ncbi:hypothetical protein AJ78_06933 [Emergomyces pasteurianus Ep9510]|uniref:Uncharacterized protein n=1 Tax=Emergomyces pasteurianus Ep9510 TaxID=1447872 RepID=A0A1J9Q8J2_9EURO|nr:hypothetical protein AJ78_06933 [Emergomyces pasteurianus Ep9510]
MFLALLKDVVTARKIGFATLTDLDDIDDDFGHAIRSRNSRLQEQSDNAVGKTALNTVRALPDNIRHDFLNFLKSDTINARHLFLAKVLPWMSQNLKRKRSDEPLEPKSQASQTKGPMESGSNQNARGSVPIATYETPEEVHALQRKRSANR